MAAQQGAAPGGARDRSKAQCRSALERWGGARAQLHIALGQCGAHPLSWQTALPVYSVRGRCGLEPLMRAAPPMPGGRSGSNGRSGGSGGCRGRGFVACERGWGWGRGREGGEAKASRSHVAWCLHTRKEGQGLDPRRVWGVPLSATRLSVGGYGSTPRWRWQPVKGGGGRGGAVGASVAAGARRAGQRSGWGWPKSAGEPGALVVLGAAVSNGARTPLGGDEPRRASSTGANPGGGGGCLAVPSLPNRTGTGPAGGIPGGRAGLGTGAMPPPPPPPPSNTSLLGPLLRSIEAHNAGISVEHDVVSLVCKLVKGIVGASVPSQKSSIRPLGFGIWHFSGQMNLNSNRSRLATYQPCEQVCYAARVDCMYLFCGSGIGQLWSGMEWRISIALVIEPVWGTI